MTDQAPPAGTCDHCHRPHFATHVNRVAGTEHRLCEKHWGQLHGKGQRAPRAHQRTEDGGEPQRGEPMEYRKRGLL